MTGKQSREQDSKRKGWDAAYREKNRERRRAYDRERMRQIRERGEQAS